MTGHLQIKKDKYYAVLNLYENGKRTQKWIPTGFPVKGNKTRAEKFLREQLLSYETKENIPVSETQLPIIIPPVYINFLSAILIISSVSLPSSCSPSSTCIITAR